MEDGDGIPERVSATAEPGPRKPRKILSEEARRAKRENDRQRARSRVNLGRAFSPWKKLRDKNGFKTDADMASFLINVYLRSRTEGRLLPSLKRSSSTETCESVHYEYPIMSSPNEAERKTCASPPVQSSDDKTESGQNDAPCQGMKSQDNWTTTKDFQDEDEEFHTSLCVGDGRYLVDLGSSSEFIVDEECILQLFESCRECSGQCMVRKHVEGLKLIVYQMCSFCQNCYKWTNLPDDDDKEDIDFQINGRDTERGQTNTTMVPK
ncbi:hypothetical protein Q5P01_026420 [Channa striata]|uniref:Uncharacterized protein n=1 Tax=Channa striata TaxID=64152 RepID=A0AA88IGF2_CHASR|nr:hypothetical protein Q5P01_026420 [Channa striata]